MIHRGFSLRLVFICTHCFAQKLLFHKDRNHEAFYAIGDHISFKLKGYKEKLSGQIIGFEDSLIVFQNYKINPQSISHMYADSKTKTWYIMKYKYDKILLIAGVGYTLIDIINRGEVAPETLIVGGSLVVAGMLAKWLIKDAIKIKNRRKLVIIH